MIALGFAVFSRAPFTGLDVKENVDPVLGVAEGAFAESGRLVGCYLWQFER